MPEPTGLTENEARELARQGRANTPVSGSTRTTARILRTTVFSFYNNVLFAIGIALLALGRYSDALVSVGLGLINAMLSAFQELRARRTLNRLQLLATEPVTVVRDGADRSVLPAEVVLGDLLRVRTGDQIVVDGPVVALTGAAGRPGLEVDESLLTGESDPVRKGEGDLLLSGSSCSSGEGLQRAEAVGADSNAGRLTLAARADTTGLTPLQWRIELVVRLVITLVVLMSGAILAQALLDGSTVLRVVQTSAVLSGLVPYGLFFLIAVAYSVGAARIAGRGALVQQVNAVEALSRVDVVCTDKTGTLTSGRLALDELVPAPGVDRESARRLLGTFARSVSAPNATTSALAADDSLPDDSLPDDTLSGDTLSGDAARTVDEVEFRSSLRWSGVTLAGPDGGRDTLVLGAPATLRSALGDDTAVLDDLLRRARELAGQGLRVLLLATTPPGDEGSLRDADDRPRLPSLRAVALVAMADELRDGVVEVLAGLAAEGVAVKVVSGDDPDTVAALARRAGLHGPAIAGPDLAALAPGEDTDAFDEAVDGHAVFGRIAPEQKEQLVDSLRRRGHQVAMVGDGVNDARALKRAHVGVAMRSGSSVTRDVADMVLLDDSFATLPLARTEGRRIISGVGSSMYLFLARVTTQMLVILTVTLLGLGFPYTPTQVGLTLFTVGLPTLFLTMWAKPAVPQEDLLVSLARFVIPVGIITAGFGTAVYAILYRFVSDALTTSGAAGPPGGLFESYTGLSSSDPEFVTASATLGAQSGLSVFISLTALVLIVLLEPPARVFASWNPVTTDRRPTLLAVGLAAAFAVVLLIPATRSYFGLTAPDPPVVYVAVPAVLVWFVVISVVLRFRVLERMLGLLGGAEEQSAAPASRR
ncbi:HAD-IC family P-type ATPase [Pseudonocardia sp. KRD291]|uniref:HAD-IC family P-type ATPase n=1 Tax=Pseudonocardia sp. KRD291 TaxID=2792007 RepID=UPI001C4A619F|nr:HAD-IC family P-type ATPase [Pseudonocardia sp. KRD291]MBW0102885.1 HAD-IC family P-type ATPase [Pseudonocardia sp. KRD291]